ncbi:response regulator [Paraneptunicella aestuarii]|uniref:two-component regulator propeller domain-containing protein n=1 Tax=Paraneptunicella aestuarii TaxID=2831148 RepID=UPI001E2DCBD8|nr:two-component regulator propeller domain-containing protein [Paraneptunicella aestuarii]UAA38831.1 response regulator [Paraneptunicella aestuarii]
MKFDGFKIQSFKSIPGDHNSLTHDLVTDMGIDRQGFIWVSTSHGLNRIDPAKNKFTRYLIDPDSAGSLAGKTIKALRIRSDGKLWLVTSLGLVLFDPDHRSYQFIEQIIPELNEFEDAKWIDMDASENLWVATRDGVLFYFDLINNSFLKIPLVDVTENAVDSRIVEALEVVSEGKVWVGFQNNGVAIYDVRTQKVKRLKSDGTENSIISNRITSIFEDHWGQIWIGTDGEGVSVIRNEEILNIAPTGEDKSSIANVFINGFYQDNNGNIWIATYGAGIYLLRADFIRVGNISKASTDWKRMELGRIWGLSVDRSGKLWVGTDQHGALAFDFEGETINQYFHRGSDANSIGHNRVMDVLQTSNGNIWFSTNRGLSELNPGTGQMHRYFYETDNKLLYNIFSRLFEDSEGNLWVSVLGGGLLRRSPFGEFTHFAHSGLDGDISHNYVTSITEDDEKRVWIGTQNGLNLFNPETEKFQHYETDFTIWSLAYDPEYKKLVIGTSGGLVITDPYDPVFTFVSGTTGVSNPSVYCVLVDRGNYYAASGLALNKVNHQGDIVSTYYWYQGFQKGYNLNSCTKDNSGNLYFGGDDGISYFHPDKLVLSNSTPHATIQSLKAYESSTSGYTKLVNTADLMSLPHTFNDLKINFSGSFFEDIEGLRFRYRLLGLNPDWVVYASDSASELVGLGPEHFSIYSNLSPGLYQFDVQYFHSNGGESDVVSLKFQILPPWWRTPVAYVGYVLVAFFLIWMVINWRTRSLLRTQVKLESIVRSRTEELQTLANKATLLAKQKDHLFANVSHDFKTPLTLILSPIEQLIEKDTSSERVKQYNLIRNNALNLQELIDQVLELSRIDSQESLKWSKVKVQEVIKEVVFAFKEHAARKDILLRYEFVNDCSTIYLGVFEGSLYRILFNLVSNAIKYSPANSQVDMMIEARAEDVVFIVRDEGIGFSEEEAKRITDRFLRLDAAKAFDVKGTGLGLAIVRELVEINGGNLDIKSEVNKGSCFTVSLPLSNKLASQGLLLNSDEVNIEAVSYSRSDSNSVELQHSKALLLIIEDNIDMAEFLCESFADDYECLHCADGTQGLIAAKEKQPDLILSDVMMPGIDGYHVARTLREQEETSHIPIIMLTAKGDTDSRIQGWQSMVDDYVAKPFVLKELRLRIQNLLEIRRLLKQKLASNIGSLKFFDVPEFSSMSSKDQLFLKRFEQVMEERYQDCEFKREMAASLLAVSERQLNRKLAALCDHNFAQYLRKFRLRKSLGLVNKGLLVAEVSDKVGFSNATYFSSCFKEEFGVSFREFENLREKNG